MPGRMLPRHPVQLGRCANPDTQKGGRTAPVHPKLEEAGGAPVQHEFLRGAVAEGAGRATRHPDIRHPNPQANLIAGSLQAESEVIRAHAQEQIAKTVHIEDLRLRISGARVKHARKREPGICGNRWPGLSDVCTFRKAGGRGSENVPPMKSRRNGLPLPEHILDLMRLPCGPGSVRGHAQDAIVRSHENVPPIGRAKGTPGCPDPRIHNANEDRPWTEGRRSGVEAEGSRLNIEGRDVVGDVHNRGGWRGGKDRAFDCAHIPIEGPKVSDERDHRAR